MESQTEDYIMLYFIFICLVMAGLILMNYAVTPEHTFNPPYQLLDNVKVISPKYLMMTS